METEPPLTLYVEFDGGSRNPGVAGYGAIVRDSERRILAERWAPIGAATAQQAEYEGLIAGLLLANAIAPAAQLIVRGDSQQVIGEASGEHPPSPGYEEICDRARQLAGGRAEYLWVIREQNTYADWLVRRAMNGGVGSIRHDPPRKSKPRYWTAERDEKRRKATKRKYA